LGEKSPGPKAVAHKIGRHPTLVLSLASLSYRCGRDLYKLRKGQLSAQECKVRAGGHVGGITGSLGGASAGAIIGSVIPGFGTLVGGFAGGVAGEYAGTKLGQRATRILGE